MAEESSAQRHKEIVDEHALAAAAAAVDDNVEEPLVDRQVRLALIRPAVERLLKSINVQREERLLLIVQSAL